MHRRSFISVSLAAVACAATLGTACAALAAASGPKVTVRIEGAKRTLLAATPIRVPGSGSITKSGAPKGRCPANSGAGALNVATKGAWRGSWSSKYDDYLITKILGDTESATKSYWEILVNDVAASTGACEIKLHAGDQLLFAAVPLSGTGYPLVIKVPATATAGSSLKVTVDEVNGKGVAVLLAGVKVTGDGATATTNAKGVARLAVKHAGTLRLAASKTGYIRAAAVTVRVAS